MSWTYVTHRYWRWGIYLRNVDSSHAWVWDGNMVHELRLPLPTWRFGGITGILFITCSIMRHLSISWS